LPSEPHRFLFDTVFVQVLTLFKRSWAKASPQKSKITITLKRHPMGMRLCSTLGFGSCPNISSARWSPGYPDRANKRRLTTTVRVTLKRTLTNSQNRHPLPISSRGLHYSRSRPRECLHLEHYLF
jgi:hypothetical protein